MDNTNKNEVLLDSMLFRMIQVSENAKKLSDERKETEPFCLEVTYATNNFEVST